MRTQPNILFLMADQMQGRVLDPASSCQTPNLDRLASSGIRFPRAYTPNPVCSPARASLMTGLLPHNHGVLWVTHCVDADQGTLRTDKRHLAQQLSAAGYRTGYFGKWHVEHSERPGRFGWQVDGSLRSELYKSHVKETRATDGSPPTYSLAYYHDQPPGYRTHLHYAVTDEASQDRSMGLVTSLADAWLAEDVLAGDDPWCCFVSLREPHDPFVAGVEAFSRYDVDSLPLPPNAHDDLTGRPELYRMSARQWQGLTDHQRREAMACYYASITEIDDLFGQLVDRVEGAGQLDRTLVVVTSDHGELLGAHGSYHKAVMASEEIYNIPLIVAGPGVGTGQLSSARIGLHQVGPTLLELAGLPPLDATDGRSCADLLANPGCDGDEHSTAYAEYFGTRYLLTQRLVWEDNWKYVHNGFAEDELYNLDDDPFELENLVDQPAHADRLQAMTMQMWKHAEETGDHSLLNAHAPHLRMARHGPLPTAS